MTAQTDQHLSNPGMPAFAPNWPGLKLGVELALLARDEAGEPMAWRWRGALWLEAEALQRFALQALRQSAEAREKFPSCEADIPNFFPGHDQNPPREPSTLGDAQALCASLWAFTPLYAVYDEELAIAQENNAAEPLHCLQLPRSPGEEGSGDFLRAAFFLARRVPPSYLESRDALTLAARSTLDALSSLGALEPGAWTEETEPAPDDWSPPWARGGWDIVALESFNDLWRKLELSLASARANPAPKPSAGRSL